MTSSKMLYFCCPPASEASREVENLTERKNLHTPVYLACKEKLNLMLKVIKLLVKVWWV